MKKLDLIHIIITVVLLLGAAVFSIISIPNQNTTLLLCSTMCLLVDLEVDIIFKRIKNYLLNNKGENE